MGRALIPGVATALLTTVVFACDAGEPADDGARAGRTAGRMSVGGFDVTQHAIPINRIIAGGPAKDGIPAIDDPKFLPASRADFLNDDDLVIGITLGSTARAYPLRVLNWHEVVNDEIDGRPLSVTFCPLTGSSVVFDRRLGDAVRSFGVSGRLYENNVLMYDRATSSLWSQLRGEAVAGELTGTSLVTLPSIRTTWGAWRSKYPATEVLSIETGVKRDYDRDPYASYRRSGSPRFPTETENPRVQAKELVLGVEIDGAAKAYPFIELEMTGKQSVRDTLAGRSFDVHFDGATAWAESEGRLADATVAYWFAWAAFHPDTDVWTAARPTSRIAEEADESAARIVVEATDSYWTSMGGGFAIDTGGENYSNSGLFVVTGTLRNRSDAPVRRVWLKFELLDLHGAPVYVEQGLNYRAEETVGMSDEEFAALALSDDERIAAGATDRYRMIFIGGEIPKFHKARVSIIAAH